MVLFSSSNTCLSVYLLRCSGVLGRGSCFMVVWGSWLPVWCCHVLLRVCIRLVVTLPAGTRGGGGLYGAFCPVQLPVCGGCASQLLKVMWAKYSGLGWDAKTMLLIISFHHQTTRGERVGGKFRPSSAKLRHGGWSVGCAGEKRRP